MPGDEFSKDKYGILEGYRPGELYSPNDDERDLIGELRKRFEDAYHYRLAWERQWELSRLYLKGQQLIIRNRTSGEIFRLPQDDSHRLLAVNNILRPTARSLLGKLTRNIPTWVTIPPTNDLTDMQGSVTADSLLYFFRRKEKLDNVYIDLYRDIILAGTGIVKLSWDRNGGKDIAYCKECQSEHPAEAAGEQCPQCQAEAQMEYQMVLEQMRMEAMAQMDPDALAMGQQPEFEEPEPPKVQKLELIKEGDIRVEIIDYRDFFVDPSTTNIHEAQWACHRVPLPVPMVRSRFPKMAKYIDAETNLYSEQHVTLLQNVANIRSDTRQLEDHVYLYEFHEKPTDSNPKGRIIWMANEVILEEIENPYYDLGRLPFYVSYWEKNKGEFYGESFIEQSWTIQRELNLLLTQLREHRELTNRPKVWAPFGSGISVEELDTTAGTIHFFNPMVGKPFYGEIPNYPNYVYNEIERMKLDIRTQASITEQEAGISRSDASGRYAAILEAQADQQVGPILRYNSTEWIELGRGILMLAQSYYSDNRKWTIIGHERPMSYTFNQMNLNPGWDIDIQEDDSLSNNHAVRLNQAISLMQAGIFTDPATGVPDVKSFARMAKLKIPGMAPETKSQDHAEAAGIPERIRNNEQFEPKPWDNPDIFEEELRAWLKGPGRHEDPMLVQQVVQIWQYYAQNTQAARQQQAMAAQQQMAAMGAEGGGGALPEGAPAVGAPVAPTVGGEAAQIAQQADMAGEAAARTEPAHEG